MTKIGLEIHCQLTKLESKLFCSCKANYREFEPNHNICPVCMGLPGSLPRLNQKAVESATSIAMALNCTTPEKIAFFRKNYFYPDLPKNFQITQLNVYGDMSVGGEGYVDVEGKKIKIRRIQLEEDPGRLIYEGASERTKITLVDYNRAGTPLVEIVTDPDFENPRQVRASVGVVPQEINLDPFFSPRKLLDLQAGLYGVKEKDRITDTILNLVSLEKEANSYARSLSGGMKRRLLMAKALVHQPPIVILDEPTAGVDVELRQNLWKNVKLLNELGVTIILTTHYLEEAEEMCGRIAILNKGNIVALDSTKNLLDRIQTKKVTFKTDIKININDDDLESLKIVSHIDNEVCVSYEKSKINMEELINLIKKNNVKIIDISTDDGDLEDVFLRLIKN